jgi:hypothetical protein
VLAEGEGWAAQFERLCERIGPRFARPEVRRRAAGFLRGLLGDVARKNGWQLGPVSKVAVFCEMLPVWDEGT